MTPQSWRQPLTIFCFFAFIATALLAPIASDVAIPNLGDYANHLAAIVQAKLALLEGQFPLRVAPSEQMGWRYPLYQFYSPSTYTFAGLIHLLLTPSNPLIAYKMTIWCALVIGGWYMYSLAYWFVKSTPAAILASVAYICAPYYIIMVDYTGSLNEAVALGLLPAALYYTLQHYYRRFSLLLFVQMSVSWYLLATTHIITFIYASFFTTILLLLVTIKDYRHWRHLISVISGYVFACLLAMWFLAPIALLQQYFMISHTYMDPKTVNLFHPHLSQLLFPAAAITTGYKNNPMLTIHPSIGWPMLLAVGLCLFACLQKYSSGHKRADDWLSSLLVLFAIVFFMVWSPVNVWQWLPQPLLAAQHSWRLLSQISWIGALLLAWAVCWLFQNRLDVRHAIIGTLLLIISASSWFFQVDGVPLSLADFLKSPLLTDNQNSYIFNFKEHPRFIDHIDNLQLNADRTLRLNAPYFIPQSSLDMAANPAIQLNANVSDNLAKRQVHLAALVNGWIVATHELSAGPLSWNIPLNMSLDSNKKQASLKLEFMVRDNNIDHQKLSIPIKKMLLTGFLMPSQVLDAKQIQDACHIKNAKTVCVLNVPASVRLLELPILYYPGLLSVTVNGRSAAYQSVLYQGSLLTSVVPDAGKVNHITVRFAGLHWANVVSWVAWGIWVLLLLQVTVIRKIASLCREK